MVEFAAKTKGVRAAHLFVVAAAAAASAAMFAAVPAARADVVIGQDWAPVPNTNGFTYYDGITNYSGNPLAQVNVAGNNWLQLDVSNAYWGQYTGQWWANAALSPANFNANPHLEFDLDVSQWHWGNLDYKLEIGNDHADGTTQGGQGGPNVIRQLGYLTVPLPSTTGNPFIQHISLDVSPLLPRDEAATYLDFLQYLEPRYWGYFDPTYDNGDGTFGAWRDTGNNYTPQRVLIDNLRLTTDPVKTNASWSVDADGNWSADANWAGADFGLGTGPAPNGAGATANILPVKHTYSTANQRWEDATGLGGHTITLDAPVTLGVLNITNPSAFTLAGPGTLTIQGAVGVPAAINIGDGSHVISAPVAVASDVTVNILPAASTLTLSNLQSTTAALTKTGAGALAVNNIRAAQLTITAGKVSVLANGTANGVSRVGALSIASGATMDLNDNHLVVDYDGATALADVQAAIVAGYAAGSWNGTGLTSSAAAASLGGAHKTALGYGEASTVLGSSGGSFAGQDVDGSAVLVRYTYSGDANLDGKVDTLDFNALAANFGGNAKIWTQADFNYDGKVDTLDFNNLAANFGQQIASSAGRGGALVPEPASSMAAMLLAGLALSRRRRKAAAARR